MTCIPGRDHRIGDRPRNRQLGIVPDDARVILGVKDATHLVMEVGMVAENTEPMGESGSHVNLLVAGISSERRSEPLAECLRLRTHIDHYVEDGAGYDCEELRLGLSESEMEATKDSMLGE